MVKLTKIYTRGGDKGETSLGDGSRTPKHDLRVAAYGSADLCRPEDGTNAKKALRIVPAQVDRLEAEIDTMNEQLDDLTSFILPGGSPASAHLHLSRTVTRRAERLVSELTLRENINPNALSYINRLSDHLFQLARLLNEGGKNDVLWTPGANR